MTSCAKTATLETAVVRKLAHEIRGAASVIHGALLELEMALGDDAERHQRVFAMARRGVNRATAAAASLEQNARLPDAGSGEMPRPDIESLSPKGRPVEPIRILVVEDDDDSAALLVCLFERQGWGVDTVSSVAAARRAFGGAQYAVLVTDLHLPDGSGTDLLEEARPAALRTALLVTGALDEPLRLRSRALGFQMCLCKPLSGTDIVDAIRTTLPHVEMAQ